MKNFIKLGIIATTIGLSSVYAQDANIETENKLQQENPSQLQQDLGKLSSSISTSFKSIFSASKDVVNSGVESIKKTNQTNNEQVEQPIQNEKTNNVSNELKNIGSSLTSIFNISKESITSRISSTVENLKKNQEQNQNQDNSPKPY